MEQQLIIGESPETAAHRKRWELSCAVDAARDQMSKIRRLLSEAQQAYLAAVDAYQSAVAPSEQYPLSAARDRMQNVLIDGSTGLTMSSVVPLEGETTLNGPADLIAIATAEAEPPRPKRGRKPKGEAKPPVVPLPLTTHCCAVCAAQLLPGVNEPISGGGLACPRCDGAKDMGAVIFTGPGFTAKLRVWSLPDGRAIGRTGKSDLGNWDHMGGERLPSESEVAYAASRRLNRAVSVDKVCDVDAGGVVIEFVLARPIAPGAEPTAGQSSLFAESPAEPALAYQERR